MLLGTHFKNQGLLGVFFFAKKGGIMLNTKTLIRQSLIAALYAVLTISLGSFGYGPIQFRYAEALNLLAFYNPIHIIGVSLGVFISNFWSELGTIDLIFGTLHTVISLIFISKSKNLWMASLFPTIFSFIIGYELSVLAGFGSFCLITGQVMISEFIIMSILSVTLFKMLEKNPQFMSLIREN